MTEALDLTDLPLGWQLKQLGDICAPRKAIVSPQDGADLPYVGLEHVDPGETRISRWGRSSDVKSSKTAFQSGDVLYGKLRPYLDKSVLAPWKGVCTTELIALRTVDGVSVPEFLVCLLHTKSFIRHAINTTGGTNLPRTSWSALREFVIVLPPLPEQRAIAHVLRTVQQAKEATEKVIAAVRQLKQSLMRHLFTYGTVSFDRADRVISRETELGPVPTHWEVVRLADVAQLYSGGTPSKQRSDFWQGAIPWASPKDLKQPRLFDVEDHISPAGLEAGSRLAPAGAVFIVVRGMILSRDIPVALAMVPMAFNQDMKAIVAGNRVNREYLLAALTRHKGALLHEIGSAAHGTKRIGTSAIEGFPLPLPPPEDQERIAAAILAIDKKIEREEGRLRALGCLFDSLLHNLMTGKVRVHQLPALATTGESTST